MILGLKKGQTNSGSFQKGEHRSKKTEFRPGKIPHNKGVKVSPELRAKNSAAQKRRFDRVGRQTNEEKNRKNKEYARKKRADNPELEREKERIYRSRILPNGSTVREMQNKQARERYAKDPGKMRIKSRADYQKNHDRELARFAKYRKEHGKEIKQRTNDLMLEVYSHYSKAVSNSDVPVCACIGCGEKHIEFLSLDHINGRKSMNHGPHVKAEKLCRRLIRDGYPKGIQILCANCNFAKSDMLFCPVHEINFSLLKDHGVPNWSGYADRNGKLFHKILQDRIRKQNSTKNS